VHLAGLLSKQIVILSTPNLIFLFFAFIISFINLITNNSFYIGKALFKINQFIGHFLKKKQLKSINFMAYGNQIISGQLLHNPFLKESRKVDLMAT
jgi:hypothetical protein